MSRPIQKEERNGSVQRCLTPRVCKKSVHLERDETVWTGVWCGEAGHIALRGSALVPGAAGAQAQVPPPPRAAPLRYWPGPRALYRLGMAHVRGLPAPPPGRPASGETFISLCLPSPHHSSSGRRRVNVHVICVPNTYSATTLRLQRNFVIFGLKWSCDWRFELFQKTSFCLSVCDDCDRDARGGFSEFPSDDDKEVCALSAEEAAGVGAGGAASDAAHYATTPRPPCYATLLRLSL